MALHLPLEPLPFFRVSSQPLLLGLPVALAKHVLPMLRPEFFHRYHVVLRPVPIEGQAYWGNEVGYDPTDFYPVALAQEVFLLLQPRRGRPSLIKSVVPDRVVNLGHEHAARAGAEIPEDEEQGHANAQGEAAPRCREQPGDKPPHGCWSSRFSGRLARSQTRTVRSSLPDASLFPSGENATELTSSLCPFRVPRGRPESTCHSITWGCPVRDPPPAATVLP